MGSAGKGMASARPGAAPSPAASPRCCQFELRDACVAYEHDRPSRRRVLLMQSNASDPSSGIQVRFAGEFVEGSSEPRVNHTRDAPKPSDGAYILGSHAFERVWHPPNRVGLVVDISMDNLWHVLFHAIPTRELVLERGLEMSSIDFLPRYTTFWPVANARDVFDAQGRLISGYSNERLKPVLQWPGWELVMRSLIGGRTDVHWPELAARTQELIAPRRWNCYRRLTGGHVGWWPGIKGRDLSELLAARSSVLSFRSVVLTNVGALERPPELRVVFELRTGSRCLVNQDDLMLNVSADPSLSGHVRFVSLATLPLAEQLRLVGTSVALAGAHGAGLAMIAFLPSGPHVRTSVLEIFPYRMHVQPTHAWYDYRRWAVMNSVDYYTIDRQKDTEGPNGCKDRDFRVCGNMTVDIRLVTARLRHMLAMARLLASPPPPALDAGSRVYG